jgi:two-component system response regulator AlgR
MRPRTAEEAWGVLRTMIVDDEPLAIERMQVLCAEIDQLAVIGA